MPTKKKMAAKAPKKRAQSKKSDTLKAKTAIPKKAATKNPTPKKKPSSPRKTAVGMPAAAKIKKTTAVSKKTPKKRGRPKKTEAEKKTLISEQDGTRTYAELVENEGRLAHAFLHELAVPAGERSCLWMWNRPEFVETQHAASAVGLTSPAGA